MPDTAALYETLDRLITEDSIDPSEMYDAVFSYFAFSYEEFRERSILVDVEATARSFRECFDAGWSYSLDSEKHPVLLDLLREIEQWSWMKEALKVPEIQQARAKLLVLAGQIHPEKKRFRFVVSGGEGLRTPPTGRLAIVREHVR